MAEKCWCDEALELEESPTGEHDLVSDIWFCPDHGEHFVLSQEQVIALVAAVRAARSHIDSYPGSGKPVEVDSIELDEKIDAALALLPKGEGR